MRGGWGPRAVLLIALLVAACPRPVAAATAAPATPVAPRPGPSVLYEPLAHPPELAVQAPFVAEPLMVSGTDAACPGEYLYQDYLFDDHGANTAGSFANGEEFGIFPPAGDVKYPTNDARYARNAADIVEFRMHPGADETVFRITFNTVVAADAPVIGIGIDTDRRDAAPAWWPNGAGLFSAGLDAFITAWGTGGEFATRPPASSRFGAASALPTGAVALDTTTNQLTIRVPRALLSPTGSWRIVAGAGLWDGRHGFLPVATGSDPTPSAPASGSGNPAPAVFNLAFRFDEKQGGDNSGNTFIGYGNWFDESQAQALRSNTSESAFADVSFADLATKSCRPIHAPGRDQARIFASHLDVPEGVHTAQPSFGGHLQPYMLRVPAPTTRPPGITLALHGNSATYTQWHVVSRRYLQQLGDARNQVVLSPLGRSTSGSGIAYDWFEAWADAAHRLTLDPSRATISGYSAGGYNTFVAGTQFPDLFGGAFPIVGAGRLLNGGAAGDYTNFDPNVGNLRWVPVVAWNQAVDELAPYIGIRGTARQLNALGLRNNLYTFAAGEHFTPGLLDQWTGAAAYLGDATVVRDPYRVDLTVAPETWTMLNPDYGPDTKYPLAHLVADHAYWVSDIRTRDAVRDDTGTIRGSITATSRAFGVADPPTSRVASLYTGPPQPATIDGTKWGALPSAAPRNEIDVQLHNVASARVDGTRARLDGAQPIKVKITSDGPATLRIDLPAWPDGLVLRVAGSTNIVVAPPAAVAGATETRGDQLPATGGDLPVLLVVLVAAFVLAARATQRVSRLP